MMLREEISKLIKKSPNPFYCYILRRPDGRPFYVGMGRGMRVFDHEMEAANKSCVRSRKIETIRKINRDGGLVNYEIAGFFDKWEAAAALEIDLISRIGRADLGKGPLCNLTDGGEGSFNMSADGRARIGAAHRGKKMPDEIRAKLLAARLGKPLSEEHRANIGAGNRGRKHSAETLAKIGAASKKRMEDEDLRAKLRAANLGRKLSAEHREKLSAVRRGKKKSDETRARMRAAWALRRLAKKAQEGSTGGSS